MSPPDVTDGNYCTRHHVHYGALEQCGECVSDPGPMPTGSIDEPLPIPPEGCMSSEDVERAFVRDAKAVRAMITDLRRSRLGEDWHVANTIAKLYDVRTKLLRAAADCARVREDEEIVKRRELRLRELRGAPH